MIKHRLVYSYWIGNEFSDIHKLHLRLLGIYNYIFDNIDLIILYDDENDIENTKANILSYINREDINFICIKNDPLYREGIVYKKFIIDRLNDFETNELVFFGHSKGVSNPLNLTNKENTRYWISIMYWGNLEKPYIVDDELLVKDNVCFGSVYNYDSSSLVKYKWQYAGAFQWINPKRLYNLIKDTYTDTLYTDHMIMRIAEEFLGNNVPTDKAAFINHQWFNKKHSLLLYEPSYYTYYKVMHLACSFMSIDDTYEFIDFINTNNLLDETSDNI